MLLLATVRRGALGIAADVTTHGRFDGLVTHDFFELLRHDAGSPAFAEGTAEVVEAGMLYFISARVGRNLDACCFADPCAQL